MSIPDESFRLHFGRRLSAARKYLGLSQDDLAFSAGIARGTLSRYERGELVPTAEVVAALVNGLGTKISADWLLFGNPDDLERPQPVVMENFGTLTKLGFGGQGTADVLMGSPEVERVLQACAAFELRKEEPNDSVIERLKSLVEYYCDEGADIELLARVVIAQRAVRLMPEIPDGTEETKGRGNREIIEAMEKMFGDKTETKQKIKGNKNQIAGRDLVNKGSKDSKKK